MLITIGMWLIPTVVSICSICWLICKPVNTGNFPGMGDMMDFIGILIPNLILWLLWALFFK